MVILVKLIKVKVPSRQYRSIQWMSLIPNPGEIFRKNVERDVGASVGGSKGTACIVFQKPLGSTSFETNANPNLSPNPSNT